MGKTLPYDQFSPTHPPSLKRPEEDLLKAMLADPKSVVVIEGPRRIGKTTLVSRALSKTSHLRISFRGTPSARKSVERIAAAVEMHAGSPLLGGSAKYSFFEGELSPPSGSSRGDLLEAAFAAFCRKAKEQSKHTVLFLDAAQNILEHQEGLEIAERLAALLEETNAPVSLLFAGSDPSLMDGLHDYPGTPFYRKARLLELKPIPRGVFHQWASKRLANRSHRFDRHVFDLIADFCRDNPGDIQRLIRAMLVLSEPGSPFDSSVLSKALDCILEDCEDDLFAFYNGLPEPQLNVYLFLSQRSRLGLTIPITGKDSLRVLDMTSAGTVQKALILLRKKALLVARDGDINPENPFLEELLARLHSNLAGFYRQRLQALSATTK